MATAPSEPFDVFLSHNSEDKPTVRQIGEHLKNRGLKVFLDEWEIRPGRPWQEVVEKVIETTKSFAVVVGKAGFGKWEKPEMRSALTQFVNRNVPVIPVLLEGGKDLPPFLKEFAWVDLRGGITEAGIGRIVWGITGTKPGSTHVPPPAVPWWRAFLSRLRRWQWALIVVIVLGVALFGSYRYLFSGRVVRYEGSFIEYLATRDKFATSGEAGLKEFYRTHTPRLVKWKGYVADGAENGYFISAENNGGQRGLITFKSDYISSIPTGTCISFEGIVDSEYNGVLSIRDGTNLRVEP